MSVNSIGAPACGACCDFAAEYALAAHPAFRAIEREVLGCDYGGTSWTTRIQADDSARPLGLAPGVHLLELGAGSGWPGLYLAERTGCRITLLDVPLIALKQARGRAAELDAAAVGVVAGSGARLPFSAASFDALAHSDVLCCLPEKQEMLAECRRVARPGARMVFFVIAPGPGLSERDRDEAREAGPPFVETPLDYRALLQRTGWRGQTRESLTVDYRATLRHLVRQLERHANTLAAVMGEAEFGAMLERRRRQARAVDAGLLIRERWIARAA